VYQPIQYTTSVSTQATLFVLVRHAQTRWNREQRYAGSSEVALADESAEQIEQLTAALAKLQFEAVYSSPLSRCQLTIAPVAKQHKLPVIIRPDLKERTLGDWEGKAAGELELHHDGYRFPISAYDGSFRIPGAEPLDALEHRIRTTLHELAEAHPGQTVLVATHGGLMYTLLKHLISNPPSKLEWPGNCTQYHISYLHGHMQLVELHPGW